MKKYAVQIKQLNKKYGDFVALNNVSLDVEDGEFLGLLGVNGAGKTSLINSVAGVSRFQGQILVNGYDVVKDYVKAKNSLGVVPQELAFDPFLTVYKSLKFQSGLYGKSYNSSWIDELMSRLYLTDKANTNTRALSGGMKRRLMVAQALVHKPQVIILDEPTTGVDVEMRQSLWGFITELHQMGHTILLTTHYLEEVEFLCDNIVMINKGNVLFKNSKDELFDRFHSYGIMVDVGIGANLSVALEAKLQQRFASKLKVREANLLKFEFLNNEDFIKSMSLMYELGVPILSINIRELSLEDVFIKVLHQ